MRKSLKESVLLLSKVVVEKEDASMVDNLMHPLNVLRLIDVRFSGKRTEVKDEHPLKTPRPKVVIFGGSVMDANDEHPKKTPSPREVMFGGSVIDANDEHPLKT